LKYFVGKLIADNNLKDIDVLNISSGKEREGKVGENRLKL
jgi:hypothetical protein